MRTNKQFTIIDEKGETQYLVFLNAAEYNWLMIHFKESESPAKAE